MTLYEALLVGMHFRPPARAIIAALPVGTELTLCREPDNPYDPNAVKVLVQGSAVSKSQEVADALEGYGYTLDDILGAEEPWHLGYIAAKLPKDAPPGITLAEHLSPLFAKFPFSASLAFTENGAPKVMIGVEQ